MTSASNTQDVVVHVNGKENEKSNGISNRAHYNEKRTEPTLGIFGLFKYAGKLDIVILFLGTVFAMGLGTCMPLNLLVYGKVANALIEYTNYINLQAIQNKTSMINQRIAALEEYSDVYSIAKDYAFWFSMIGVGAIITGFLAVTLWTLAAERQIKTIRQLFFTSVMRQEIGWFDTHESGELSTRFSEDMHVILDGIGDKVATMIQWMTTFIAAFIIAFISGWKLSLASVAFCPVLVVVGAFMTRWLQTISRKEAQSYASAGAVAEEVFLSIRTVMAFNGQTRECERYNENLKDANSQAIRKGIVTGLGQSVFWFFSFSAFAVAFWYGIYLIRNGEAGFEAGETLTIFMGVMIGSMSLGQAFPTLEVIGNARGAAQKVFEIIDQKSEIDFSSKEGRILEKVEGNIGFKNLYFRYPARPDVQVLRGLSLDVRNGQTVALVGSSGCGKSTGIQLLQRFYNPEQGEIYLDGENIKELNVNWLRKQIGVVSQEPVLFATTIAENIRYGRIDVTQADIEQACKMANAHDFIKQLPEGFETLVGDRGAQLSGGQKQRIAIARALVRNPKILLLDEATSALDNESEGIVQKALEKAQEGRTTIVIAHRLSTIRNADVIYAIDQGVIKESGTHDELMGKKGLYHQLVMLQTKHHDKLEAVVEELEHTLLTDENNKLEKSSLIRPRTFSSSSLKNPKLHTEVSVVSSASDSEQKKKNDPEDIPNVPMTKILKMNGPEFHLIVIGIIISILAGGSQPLFSIILSEFLKVFTYDDDEAESTSEMLVIYIMTIAVVSAIFKMITFVTFGTAGGNLTTRFRKLAFKSIVWQDVKFFDDPKNTVGSLTTRLSSDAALVQGATGSKIGVTLEAMATILVALSISFYYSWKLTLVTLGFLPLMIVTGIVQSKILTGFARGDKDSLDHAGKILSEAIDNIRTVASLTREETFVGRYDEHIDQVYTSSRKRSLVNGFVYGLSNSIMFFAYAGAFTYGSYLVQTGELEFHLVFRVFIAIIIGGMYAGRTLSMSMDFKKGQIAAARLFDIIERKPDIDAQEEKGDKLDNIEGDIEFTNVKFRYPSRPDVQVLKGLTIRAKPGETVALVGTSGCGKSTTVQLLERFYDQEDGRVTLDGTNTKDLNINWLRSKIGIVSQEPVLFDASIAGNIAYGDTSRTVPMPEIIEAARSANIHTFIEKLPHGYDTNVGDKGTQLSGGQKQRVAIARALVKNPKILLLDEATSALDTESERVVQEALDKAQQGRTCFVIAHRLSTIKNSNKIAIIHKGEVVELGNHAELMAFKGIYYKLSTHNQGK
ncbi:ATP-dependent translocase ABCB1-like isoform X1 [Mytilus galloprovincialis]|uniref:ATP-dependent translocase ABCB1-like isoform X1 n=2 Tax=Mytilus galloprovincialis TaxID=29158 RepID=UPI003F7B6DC2